MAITHADFTEIAMLCNANLKSVRQASDRLVDLAGRGTPKASFDEVAALVHGLCAAAENAEESGIAHSDIQDAMEGARKVHGRSPFIARLQTWPRGYPGDFETIEYLISGKNRAEPATVEYWLEFLAIQSPIAQQHRNKVAAQAREIERAVRHATGGSEPKVLILAAGSCPDLGLIQNVVSDHRCSVVVNDGDEDALAYSGRRLSGIGHRLQFVGGNVLTSTNKLAPLGPFDLIVAGGLFDYLPDRHAEFLIRTAVSRLLAPGGRLFFTNLGTANPYRVWIEHLANWKLIGRSTADLNRLVADACHQDAAWSIAPETTGLTWLVAVDRN